MPLFAGPVEHDTPEIRWEKMLQEYLTGQTVKLPVCPKIINIGCGNNVTWNYLGMSRYLAGRELGLPHYVGVDIKEEAYREAKATLKELVRFLTADARRLSDVMTDRFHLALFEHPDLTASREGPKIWGKIFQETARVLEPGAGVILTSFWLNDHLPAQVALERAGYRILLSRTNKYPGKVFNTDSKGETLQYDKYILIAQWDVT
jgi:SAM-dependent methyltransferase